LFVNTGRLGANSLDTAREKEIYHRGHRGTQRRQNGKIMLSYINSIFGVRAYPKNGAITGVPFILSLAKDAGNGGSTSCSPRTVRMFLG
jgi:hypothetical protein